MQFDKNDHAYEINGTEIMTLEPRDTLTFWLKDVGHIYGHGFNHNQPFPLSQKPLHNSNFAVNNINSPIWLCSKGLVIKADTFDALEVELKLEPRGCLQITAKESPLVVRLWQATTLAEALDQFLVYLNRPTSMLDDCFVGDSLFCTWTQYPRCISQDIVLDFAQEIRGNQYPCSAIIIDDQWENCYGDLTFAPNFADPKGMVEQLHRQGFKVILWVTPFVNIDSANFTFLQEQGWLVKSKEAGVATFRWWGGEAGLIDLTNPEGAFWYESQLRRLKETYGIDGFKIDGGDAKYQPDTKDAHWYNYAGASGYSDILLSIFEKVAPGLCETRTAWLSQSRSIVWRQGGKDSHWGEDNGLKALVHLGLHLALMGYDFFIPDMVGGRIQTMSQADPLVSDELFLRFAEVSAFMPSLQFSYFPWNYGEVVKTSCMQLALCHKAMGDYIKEQLKDSQHLLIRPLWYVEPNELTWSIDDQFLLGPDILVCPILESGQVARDVYLPAGSWLDGYSDQVIIGPVNIPDYPAPCPGIPVFIRQERFDLYHKMHPYLKDLKTRSVLPQITTATYESGIQRDIKVTG